MQACLIAVGAEANLHKATLTLPSRTSYEEACGVAGSAVGGRRIHVLTDFRNATQHPGAVLGIEPRVAPQTAHVLGGM